MLEQILKSSCLFQQFEKLHVDFLSHSSVVWLMINLDEFDPRKARSGLFALVTAHLEDAHEIAVSGQRIEIDQAEALRLLDGLINQTDQIEIMMMAIAAIRE